MILEFDIINDHVQEIIGSPIDLELYKKNNNMNLDGNTTIPLKYLKFNKDSFPLIETKEEEENRNIIEEIERIEKNKKNEENEQKFSKEKIENEEKTQNKKLFVTPQKNSNFFNTFQNFNSKAKIKNEEFKTEEIKMISIHSLT